MGKKLGIDKCYAGCRVTPAAPCPFLGAAGRGRGTGMDAGVGSRTGGARGGISREPRSGKGTPDAVISWAGFLNPGGAGSFWASALHPRRGVGSPCLGVTRVHPGRPWHPWAGPRGPRRGGRAGRTERATRRLVGRAAGRGQAAPGRC